MKNVVGQAVRKDDFWPRDIELEDIWQVIESNCHILLCAPRRVGKTSIMLNLLDEPKQGYIAIYIDTESADTQAEFWGKLYHTLIAEEFVSNLKSKTKSLWQKIKTIKIDNISISGVKFGDSDVMDHKQAVKRLIEDLELEYKLIIMLDEFAQTIENIIQYESEQSAVNLLKAHRELRLDQTFSEKAQFIYAGSIGLESVVAKINSSKHINDLNSVKVPPLTFDEAEKFTSELCQNIGMEMSTQDLTYLLAEIHWLIPFYIQLIIQELKKLCRRGAKINQELINQAIENALDNRNYFDSWQSKLKTGFEKNEYLFAKEVLNQISEKKALDSLTISNIGSKHGLTDEQGKECIHSLSYDGYINNNGNAKIYQFNSPILRMWWNKNVAN